MRHPGANHGSHNKQNYLHRDQISKPLVRQLVRDYLRDAVAILEAGDALLIQQIGLAVRHLSQEKLHIRDLW